MQEGNKAKENSGELYSVVQMRRFNIPIEGSRAAHSKLHKSRLGGGKLVKKTGGRRAHFFLAALVEHAKEEREKPLPSFHLTHGSFNNSSSSSFPL